MANRYWVGGAGTWDTASTTHWSASSGGASGASVPTAADSVFFDSLSGTPGAVTMTGALNCLDFTTSVSGWTFATGTTPSLGVYGNFLLNTGTVWTSSAAISFAATTTGFTITTNGTSIGTSAVSFNGASGGWTLGSALTASTVNVNAGTFSTGNFSIIANSINSTGATTRAINLGSSTITLQGSGVLNLVATGLTFNAGTSQINVTGAGAFTGGGVTFYNVTFPSNAGGATISGANTFNNLTFLTRSSYGITTYTIAANQTVNGTFTCPTQTAAIYRVQVVSSTVGTPVTITAATTTLNNVDFQDITAAGTGSWSGTSVGNKGGNTGITFSAAKTVYWNLAGTQNWASTGWATSSGGTPAAANFPLPQDTAVFDNAGAIGTITMDNPWYFGTFNSSARTTAATFASGQYYCMGNWLIGAGISGAGFAGTMNFVGRGNTQQITSAGNSVNGFVTVNNIGGIVQLQDNLTIGSTSATTLTNGTLDLNSKVLSCGSFLLGTGIGGVRTLAFGTGNITLNNSGSIWSTDVAASTTLTITGTPTVNVAYAGAVAITITPGTLAVGQAPNFNFLAGTYSLAFSSARNFGTLDFTGFSGSVTAISINITGGLTISPTMTFAAGGAVVWTFIGTAGPYTINGGGISVDRSFVFNGVGGTWTLGSAVTLAAVSSVGGVTLTNGTINLASFTFTAASFTTATGVKTLTYNSGSLVLTGSGALVFNNAAPTSFTQTAGTGNGIISMTSASAKTFVGAGATFPASLNQGGAGALTVTGANTFFNITNTNSTASTITFPSSTITTVNNFTAAGTVGNLLTINSSTSGTQATINLPSNTSNANYLSVKDINFTPSPSTTGLTPYVWYLGANSTNGGNNTGGLFQQGGTGAIKVYTLTTGTSWTVPTDWNSSNNVYLFGAGGGGAGSYASGNNRAGGGGGGGGGYTAIANFITKSGSAISYIVGSGGSAGTAAGNGGAGGSTTWNAGNYTAGGGGGGTASTVPASSGGTGGTGSTYAGGTGGAGSFGTTASSGQGGGGGGGAGGSSGIGGNGGTGFGSTTSANNAGGGGGGNGGGTTGGNATSGVAGTGGNNASGIGGGAANTAGAVGGGGGGGLTTTGGAGGAGIDLFNSIGGGGGAGGANSTTAPGAGGIYGGGGAGGGLATAGTTGAGSAGGQGLIVISYVPKNITNFILFLA